VIKTFTVLLVFWDVHELSSTDDAPAMVFTQCSTGVWLKPIREESSTVRGGTVGTPVTNYVLDYILIVHVHHR
jgi:hypothetical protein